MRLKDLLYCLPILLFLASCNNKVENMDPADIPEEITSSFQTDHPNASEVVWGYEDNCYEVDFVENDIEKSIEYNSEGRVIEYESEIPIGELPPNIQNYIAQEFPDFEIEEADELEDVEGMFYSVELEKGGDEMELIFDREGNFLKQNLE